MTSSSSIRLTAGRPHSSRPAPRVRCTRSSNRSSRTRRRAARSSVRWRPGCGRRDAGGSNWATCERQPRCWRWQERLIFRFRTDAAPRATPPSLRVLADLLAVDGRSARTTDRLAVGGSPRPRRRRVAAPRTVDLVGLPWLVRSHPARRPGRHRIARPRRAPTRTAPATGVRGQRGAHTGVAGRGRGRAPIAGGRRRARDPAEGLARHPRRLVARSRRSGAARPGRARARSRRGPRASRPGRSRLRDHRGAAGRLRRPPASGDVVAGPSGARRDPHLAGRQSLA